MTLGTQKRVDFCGPAREMATEDRWVRGGSKVGENRGLLIFGKDFPYTHRMIWKDSEGRPERSSELGDPCVVEFGGDFGKGLFRVEGPSATMGTGPYGSVRAMTRLREVRDDDL